MASSESPITPLTPEKFTGIRMGPPKKSAGGMPAVVKATQFVFSKVGFFRGSAGILKMNKEDGFDCSGCAWPDPDNEGALVEFCENGAKAFAEEATDKKAGPDFFKKNSVSSLSQWSDFELGSSGRLTHPMIIREGESHYSPVSWKEALEVIGSKLRELPDPNQAVFYTSGRTSNEAAFMYQLMVRMYGTNNLPDCSNMCHESSGVALTETVGIGKGSVTLEDFYRTELILIFGQNPGTNHPRMLSALQKAKNNGAKIITINPIREAGLLRFRHPQKPLDMLGKGTRLTDLYLPVRVNEDVALIKAWLKILLDMEDANPGHVLDQEFITNKTSGFEELKEDLSQWNLEELILRSGVEEAEIRKGAKWIAGSGRIIACWAMGLTQHENAVDNIREIVNLLLFKGAIGRPGAGTCPVRGHSNVQGDRTMGINERAPESFLKKLGSRVGFDPPLAPGFNTVETIAAMADGRIKAFIAMGGNFLSATPDTPLTARGLQQCDLTVSVSTKLNRTHLLHGKIGLILPCLVRSEEDIQAAGPQLVSVENSTGLVHSSKGTMRPASEHLLSEPAIISFMAKAILGGEGAVDWESLAADYDRIRDLIEAVIPGFENYNERVKKPGGFYLPNSARGGVFDTPSGKAVFTINKPANLQQAKEDLVMMTIRSHDQFNTTIYALDDRYRGVYNERRVIFMNEEDMASRNLKKGQVVNITSYYDGQERIAPKFIVVPYDIPRGSVATYFPEANVLVPANRSARGSHTPISKSVLVRVNAID